METAIAPDGGAMVMGRMPEASPDAADDWDAVAGVVDEIARFGDGWPPFG
jgi:hypothetical protein